MTQNDLLIEIKNLKTHFFTDEGIVRAVDGVDMEIYRNKTLCVVGESGCGKSITARSILQIVDPPGRVVEGEMLYHRRSENGQEEVIDLAALHPRSRLIRDIRGKDISMIFQEPMTSLSPIHTVGDQIVEAITLHTQMGKDAAKERTIELLRRVGIPQPAERFSNYPFQLSGGMRQRVMIAMALSCNPALLIADEPTTAVDVTTQAQILELLLELQEEFGMGIVLITHDLGVVAEMADDVAVMYLGRVAERGDVDSIFYDPKHPYTQALLRSIPKLRGRKQRERLDSIQGMVPDPLNRPPGCPFWPRCDEFMEGKCDTIVPQRVQLGNERDVRCLLYGGEDGPREGVRLTEAVKE
ncbi:MAG: ABC transporter ATP-binding protein [Caldilineaceae bacterium]|nr:ABC transporter ATP-binding protein [Caldilineaceae bacterium]